MPEKFPLPKSLENYINTGALDRIGTGESGSFINSAFKALPAAVGAMIGGAIGAWLGDKLGKWVAGWFSDKMTEAELRTKLQSMQVIPAFTDILSFDNLKATENESRGAGSILDDVYGKQCVSKTELRTTNDIAGFIKNYIENVQQEAQRLADGYNELIGWWDGESQRLIAEGNKGRETWFAMYNALVGRKAEIILSRTEEVLGDKVEMPPNGGEITIPEEEKKVEIAGFELSPTVLLLIGGLVLALFSSKS
jgi:hypothetical protein